MKPVAIIPARGSSKRFPRKNIADLNGRPLISYSIAAALKSEVFGRVIVSSEDNEILGIAKAHGAETFVRSKDFATDTAHELEACAEVLDDIERKEGKAPALFCIIYPTAIMVEADDLRGSYEKISDYADADALMCVSGFNYHPYKALKENDGGYLEMLFPEHCLQRSQTYPDLTASNGTFYWLRTASFRKNRQKGYYQDKLIAYKIEAERAVDIDYPEDLKRIELMLRAKED